MFALEESKEVPLLTAEGRKAEWSFFFYFGHTTTLAEPSNDRAGSRVSPVVYL